ncbi:MAG: LL-diaminopimelate aminotransferase [Firmicutes bacterium]|nr:LL-diaminopimelate aminotransferase [Bacillota bacterium]
MDYILRNVSKRLGGSDFNKLNNNFKFSKIKKLKKEIVNKYPDIPLIDLGIGEPDLPADMKVINTLKDEAYKPENRLYSDNGIYEFKLAACNYLKNIFNVDIDPDTEILHGLGAKSILSLLPYCFINPGDITITTIPGYPVLATHTKYLDGKVYNLKLTKENNFFPDLDSIPKNILKNAKLIYINYPNNPTGQIANKDFYKRLIDFAYKNNLIVISDSVYANIVYDTSPLSFLSIDGAKDIGVEIHSLSKAFNMTGWRLAFIAGNKDIIKLYSIIKSNSDSGQFRAIQKAGISALNNPDIVKNNIKRYSKRFELLINALKEVGFSLEKPKGTYFCYTKIPKGTKSGIVFKNAEEVSDFLLKKALISTVPWDDAGSYLRFSVTFIAKDYKKEKEIINTLKERLKKLELLF